MSFCKVEFTSNFFISDFGAKSQILFHKFKQESVFMSCEIESRKDLSESQIEIKS